MVDQEQQEEIENCLKSISKLKSDGLAELNRRVKEDFNIKEETVVSASTTSQVEDKKAASDVNVSLKILEVNQEISKALHVYKTVQSIVNANNQNGQISVMGAKKMIEEGKLILESIPKTEAEKYKKQLEKD